MIEQATTKNGLDFYYKDSPLCWTAAIDSWKFGQTKHLSKMISLFGVPDQIKDFISKIVSGDIKPNMKAAAKLKIPAEERMLIANYATGWLSVCDLILEEGNGRGKGKIGYTDYFDIADKKKIEPIEFKRMIEAKQRKFISGLAEVLNVSTETIEDLIRDFNKYEEFWK
ncbi:MAG: hypothetical protein PHE38_07215 [Alishewanella agri]|nr:hypothetical protein [Alishewanella agri]